MDSHASSLDNELFENADGALPRLFTDANLYETLIYQSKYISPGENGDNIYAPGNHNGFAHFIAKDLDSSDKAVAGRVAKISVTGDTWVDFTSEPESYNQSSEPPFADEQEGIPSDNIAIPDGPVDGPVDKQISKLSPAEIAELIVDEFGPLAVDDEEEALILEADGALSLNVLILVR